MNVSIATVSTRLKEIGIRKVVGGTKKELIQQFLIENIVFCILALFTGTVLCYFFLLPAWNIVFGLVTPFSFSSWYTMALFFGGLLLFIAVVSGAYPALYISSFNAIKIIRGKEKFGSKGLFSKVLLNLQFILAFTIIVGCFVFAENSFSLARKDWGYAHEQLLVVPVQNHEQYISLRDKAEKESSIIDLAGAQDHVGKNNRTIAISKQNEKIEVLTYSVGVDYLQVMNFRLQEGRLFDQNIQSDRTESVVINETFAKRMDWNEAINQSFEYDSVKYTVVGVVSDFHHNSFYNAIKPVMFRVTNDAFKYLVMKVGSNKMNAVEASIKNIWPKISADDPYTGFVQHDVFGWFYQNNRQNVEVFIFISIITLIVACLGLYGLVSYNITRRLKEFSIRKIMGANLGQIFKIMSSDYQWILIIAFVVGAPLGFYLMNMLISAVYPFPQPIKTWPFFIAIIMIMAMVGLTIATQLNRVRKENPADTLKSE
jgi:putative ABC transport system permease protein